jgi:hypothetical protein
MATKITGDMETLRDLCKLYLAKALRAFPNHSVCPAVFLNLSPAGFYCGAPQPIESSTKKFLRGLSVLRVSVMTLHASSEPRASSGETILNF